MTLSPSEYKTIGDEVAPAPGAPIAVVGAGTGLGETYLTSVDDVWEAWPSEGGHVAFSPRNEKECRLLMFLQDKLQGRVSTERIVSGPGIVNVYEFLASENPSKVNPELDKKIREDEEGARYVSEHVHDDELCKETIQIVMSAYGCEVSNCLVKFLPFGGLYIAGGVARKNMDFFDKKDSPFMQAYGDCGRMSHLVKKVPLRLVNDDDLGLRGAQYVAIRTAIRPSR
eukprot:gnl/TRDRNA2_/TRDRNA2_89294_c0_seq1.p1 gnl/TRDRNA2_/TRDRNA2_89294_c0~~gnl/TRDRNA2_/TRDRNA2_89294_c0_seq1.p1  ORF type:complete len:248 (-),score=43.15 gnl/TRDRNA2_/TRDRNA2_89294_c0_seq1:48-728(-)